MNIKDSYIKRNLDGDYMELIDIYDENNNYLGYSVDRKEAHDNNGQPGD